MQHFWMFDIVGTNNQEAWIFIQQGILNSLLEFVALNGINWAIRHHGWKKKNKSSKVGLGGQIPASLFYIFNLQDVATNLAPLTS